MKICVMTAITNADIGSQFLGVVVGLTLDECKRKAKTKWSWYQCKDKTHLYYSGYPTVSTRWMNVEGRRRDK